MVTYEKTFDDFGIKGIFVHNINQREWTNNNTLANGLIVDGLYTYTNAKATSPVNYYEINRPLWVFISIWASVTKVLAPKCNRT